MKTRENLRNQIKNFESVLFLALVGLAKGICIISHFVELLQLKKIIIMEIEKHLLFIQNFELSFMRVMPPVSL